MSGKVIAKLLCGECPVNRRTVLAILEETPEGAVLRVAPGRARWQDAEVKEGVPLASMPGGGGWWWPNEPPAAVALRCTKHRHAIFAVFGDTLRELEAEYRRADRTVVRVVDLHR